MNKIEEKERDLEANMMSTRTGIDTMLEYKQLIREECKEEEKRRSRG